MINLGWIQENTSEKKPKRNKKKFRRGSKKKIESGSDIERQTKSASPKNYLQKNMLTPKA